MKSADAKRIEELSQVKPSDFVLRDIKTINQGEVEEWIEAMREAKLDEPNANLVRARRLSLQAAYTNGWFDKAPTLSADEFRLLRPALVSVVGDAVLNAYAEITAPDPSFT